MNILHQSRGLLTFFWCGGLPLFAAELQKQTLLAFDDYIRTTEARLEQHLRASKTFLWTAESAERAQQVRQGQIPVQPWGGKETIPVPGGLIHDWIGAVFIPGATLKQTLALVQDYNHHKDIYQPEVMDSRLLSRHGEDFKIYLRLLKKKVLTVVLNTEHDVRYFPLDRTRWHSRSYSTHIFEVQDPGKPNEHPLPAGHGHGFLWRLYSYWKFEERDGGVYVECEAISLTRAVPTGLNWLIAPIIRDLPRQSLADTLRSTRIALKR